MKLSLLEEQIIFAFRGIIENEEVGSVKIEVSEDVTVEASRFDSGLVVIEIEGL
ncbi:MAG: hypothetical protein WDA59_00270 [Methanofastidiosum sp.]|jgi:hypothetical protein